MEEKELWGKTASEVDHEEDKILEETLSDSGDLQSSNEGCANADGKTASHCEQDSSAMSEKTAPRANWVMNGVITVVVIAAVILLRYLKFKMRDKINKA